MSDADPEAVTVSADDITVRKSVDTERFQTLAVVLELASARDDVARVQLVDRIPTEVPIEDVGFHPDYGSEHWSVEEGSVAFERDFEPGEAYTTIYGIRDYPEDDIDALLADPKLGLIDTGPDSLDEVIDEGRSEAVREFLSGEADLPGLDEEVAADAVADAAETAEGEPEPVEAGMEAGEADAEPEPAEVEAEPEVPEPAVEPEPTEPEPVEPAEAEPAEAAPEPAVARQTGGEREVRVPLTGGVVRVLIKELRDGDVDPEDRRMLRDELLGTEGSTEARITHLQQRVSDLEAYADALEEFIDEEGTAEEIITDLRDMVAGLEREVRAVDDRLDETIDDLASVDDRADDLADDVASVGSRADVLADRVEDVEADVTGVDERTDDLGARIDRVSADLDGVDERVSTVDGRVDDLRDEFGSIRRDLRADIEALERDLADFETFRERLSSVFGGGGPPGPGGDESVEEE